MIIIKLLNNFILLKWPVLPFISSSASNFITSCDPYVNVILRIPKTIKEAIDFNEFEDNDIDYGREKPTDYTSEKNIDEPVNELNVETFINDTRKKSLQIMAKLADEPESKTYEIAKRIWQICDKSLTDEKVEQGGNEIKH